MSPEQARGELEQLDRRSDIYALGAILYDILVLRSPVRGDDSKAIADKIAQGRDRTAHDGLSQGETRAPRGGW